MESERIDQLIAGQALDALSEEDERELEEHLRRSPEAREQLAALQEAASALAYGVETPAPPPELRARLLAEASAQPQSNVVPLRRRWTTPALGAVAAAAAAVAIGLGIWGASLSGDLSDERAVAASQSEVLALYADPQSTSYPVEGADGTLVVAPGGQAGLVLTGLDAAPDGKTYQAWVIEGEDAPASAGIFSGGGSQAIVPLELPVPAGATVAVTVEQAGGAEQPTTDPFLVVPTAV
jgi:anti-sigma-K factor RskA